MYYRNDPSEYSLNGTPVGAAYIVVRVGFDCGFGYNIHCSLPVRAALVGSRDAGAIHYVILRAAHAARPRGGAGRTQPSRLAARQSYAGHPQPTRSVYLLLV